MGTKRVIIWDKETTRFDNDELGEAGEWAEHHMINCPQMKHSGIAYSTLTKESEGGGYVGITKIAECRACHTKYILSQYFIDVETGKYVKD